MDRTKAIIIFWSVIISGWVIVTAIEKYADCLKYKMCIEQSKDAEKCKNDKN